MVIKGNVNNIDYAAFNKCSSLEWVEINAIVPPTIGDYIFGGCTNLTSIYVPFESVASYNVSWDVYGSRITYKVN